ncbi:MAG: indole-3-glycerol phosphate synthase TrpC [Chloroflexi bacterium]|nr:indole-3-glycerol phosphate synthase TrpC [Chloroflexota bacterium]
MAQSTRHSILDTILAHKRDHEVPQRKRCIPLSEMRRQAEAVEQPALDFTAALQSAQCVALIAEVKRASPSKGDLVNGEFRPLELAQTYEAAGAAAVSVLTDERFFKGSLKYLTGVKQAVRIPVLRKDFIVDEYQLYEARAAGADAALLIVAALDDATLEVLHTLALELGLVPLVEVHDEAETERALRLGARVIGVNNRDLRTFATDIRTTERCARLIANSRRTSRRTEDSSKDPATALHPTPLIVSESGIFTPGDVAVVSAMGARAVLVGESIITAGNIAGQVRALAHVPCGG